MAFAADFSRGAPSDATALATLRRRHAHDRLYGLALVAGCLVGVGISWQAVLSEGARDRLVAGLFGPAEKAAARMEVAAPRPAMASSPAPVLPERLLLDDGETERAADDGLFDSAHPLSAIRHLLLPLMANPSTD